MTRNLDDLSSRSKPKFFEFLARCTEAGIAVMIVNVLRTEAEQAENIKKGVSWTKNSNHLPKPPEMKSEAIDICPYEMWSLYGPDKLEWNSDDPVWQKLGEIGKKIGLGWGGDWKQKDMGHFEFKL